MMRSDVSVRSRAIIHLDALQANYARLLELTHRSVALMCVVKSGAYGHGALAVGQALTAAGCGHLAVTSLDEAVGLRDAGVTGNIYVLTGLAPGEEHDAAMRGIQPVVGSLDQLRRWDEVGMRMSRRLSFHLLLNSGFNRLGMDLDPTSVSSVESLASALGASAWTELVGVATHYASAEDLGSDQSDRQDAVFGRQIQAITGSGRLCRYVHVANSAAILYRGVAGPPESAVRNMARPGLALYGYVKPCRGAECTLDPDLRPVLEWRARLLQIRDIPMGAAIGYGATFVAPHSMRIGVLGVGYADGLPLQMSNRGSVGLRGLRCPIVGEVSMDLTTVDLGSVPDAAVGDEVTLIGEPPYDAQGMADLAGTSVYEILCGIGPRVRRQPTFSVAVDR